MVCNFWKNYINLDNYVMLEMFIEKVQFFSVEHLSSLYSIEKIIRKDCNCWGKVVSRKLTLKKQGPGCNGGTTCPTLFFTKI